MTRPSTDQFCCDRRSLLVAGGVGFCGLDVRSLIAALLTGPASERKAARSTILIFLQGGASHIDTWDMKPEAPAEYRGEFQPIEASAPGVRAKQRGRGSFFKKTPVPFSYVILFHSEQLS